jgi:hypothetical protein
MPCRQLDLFSEAIVAIDGSKFKAVNNPQAVPGATALLW